MNEILSHIALFVWLVGIVIFAICSAVGKYPDLKRVGEIMFAAGLLAWLLGK